MDIVVKTEEFLSLDMKVRLVTVELDTPMFARYFSIIREGKVAYISPKFYGGSREDIVRNCDSALQVVRQLLADTQFLRGEVVGT